jgi:hypothetical protein
LGLLKSTVWGLGVQIILLLFQSCPVNSNLDEVEAIEKWETEFELANMYSIQYSPIKKIIDLD